MRLLTHRFSRLGAIILLAGATGAVADSPPPGPLAERGTWALGFDLHSGEGGSFSLWRVCSPKTALGLEASLYGGRNESEFKSPDRNDLRYHHLSLEFRPTLKRYRPLRDGIAAYVYGQGLGGFSGLQERRWRVDQGVLYIHDRSGGRVGTGRRLVSQGAHQRRRPDRAVSELQLR